MSSLQSPACVLLVGKPDAAVIPRMPLAPSPSPNDYSLENQRRSQTDSEKDVQGRSYRRLWRSTRDQTHSERTSQSATRTATNPLLYPFPRNSKSAPDTTSTPDLFKRVKISNLYGKIQGWALTS